MLHSFGVAHKTEISKDCFKSRCLAVFKHRNAFGNGICVSVFAASESRLLFLGEERRYFFKSRHLSLRAYERVGLFI